MIFYVKLFVFIILLDIDTKLVIVIFDNNVGTHIAAFKLLTVYKDVFEEFKFFYKAVRGQIVLNVLLSAFWTVNALLKNAQTTLLYFKQLSVAH